MPIFTRADLPTLRADRLLRIGLQLFPDNPPSDDYLMEKLLAAEVGLEQQLRTTFSPREVLPTGAAQSEFDAALLAAGQPAIEEPGYDYDPQLFQGEGWGLMQLRHKPILAVHSIVLAYPNVDARLFEIPQSWIRPEKKYGRLNIVPSTDAAVNLPANAYILSALAGGRIIPFMVKVRYRVGFADLRTERPDIVDAIKRLAVLSILDDQYFPQSGSTSVDGLSQSFSLDVGKHRELLDTKIAAIESGLSGIRFIGL